jgi:hypothetical protein
MPSNSKQLISINEAAKILGVSTKTLRRWEARGILIPTRTSGGHRRYVLAKINNFKRAKGKKRISEPTIKTIQQPSVTHKDYNFASIMKQIYDILPALQAGFPVRLRRTKPPKEDDISAFNSSTGFARGFLECCYKSVPKSYKGIVYVGLAIFLVLLSTTFLGSKGPFENLELAQNIQEKLSSVSPFKPTPKIAGIEKLRKDIASDQIGPAVLAATSFDNVAFKVNVESFFGPDANFEDNVVVNGSIAANGGNITTTATEANLFDTTATTLNIGGSATVISLGATTGTTSINNVLDVASNNITSPADLVIDPGGGGVSIGTGTASSVDLAGDDFYVTGDFEVDGTAYIPTLSVNDDSFTDLTGTGLTISSGALQASLGTSIETGEITNDTILEVDLDATNTATDNYVLTYDSSSGGFTWAVDAGGIFTDAGTYAYLTQSTDNLTIGGTSDLAKLAIDGDTNEIQLLVQGNSTQTANLAVFEQSDGTDILSISNSGIVTLMDGGLLDLASITHNDTALQGLRLPQAASFTSPSSGEGLLAWDTDDDALAYFDGSTWNTITGGGVTGSGTSGRITFWTSGSAVGSDSLFFWDNTNDLLGIGTGSPTSQLHVTGTYSTAPLAVLNETGGNVIFEAQTSGTPVARITNAGNILLTGTLNTVSGNLTIDSVGGTTTIADIINLGSSSTGVNVTTAGIISDTDGNLVLADTVDIGSATTGLRVTTAGAISDIDGNLAINDNTDITGNLDVSGTLTAATGDAFQVNASGQITAATGETINGIDISSGAVSDVVSLALTTAGNTWDSSGNLTTSGDVTINGGNLATTLTALNIDVANTGTISLTDGTNNLLQVSDDGDYGILALTTAASQPATCTEGEIYADANNNLYYCESTNTWIDLTDSGGSVSGSGSAGQTAFWTGASALSGNNDFWWDNTNELFGIGTAGSPAHKLHVTGGYQGNALAVLNETLGNDILAASQSGTTVARITNAGNI